MLKICDCNWFFYGFLCAFCSRVFSLDNSEWMRNGDYNPSRIEAQHDAVTLIAGSKTQQNPENVVGLMTSADR